MRFGIALAIALLLAGCAPAVENPRTGERVSCSDGPLDISPWSQSDACVAKHVAEGWVSAED